MIDVGWSLSKNHISLESIWLEYVSPFEGKPAIRKLDERFGTKWRCLPSMRKLYSRRLYVYKAVSQVAQLKGISELEAVKFLDMKRSEKKQSVASFQDKVCKFPESIAALI